MIGKKTLELLALGDTPYDYILGCRMRKQNGMGDEIFPRGGRYEEVAENLKVKDICVGDLRTSSV
jgi:hypothetical protein